MTAKNHAEPSLMSPDAPVWIPRTTTLVLTPSQLRTVRGTVAFMRRAAEQVEGLELDALEIELAGLRCSPPLRAPREPDASVRDRLLMLLDTALTQDGPEVELPVPDTERPLPGPSKPADEDAAVPDAPEAA